MNTPFDQVLQAALSLPVDQRAHLIDSLLDTLPPGSESPLDEAWLEEIERRSNEIDAGAVELVPWEEARRRVTEQLREHG